MLYIVIAIRIFSTLYSYAWDLYMDWGLLRSLEPKKRFLRTKLLFSTWFYYYAAVSNLILRFVWALPLIKTLPEWIHNT
jgi:xenotropic and polytropic retrovirus receptor 1